MTLATGLHAVPTRSDEEEEIIVALITHLLETNPDYEYDIDALMARHPSSPSFVPDLRLVPTLKAAVGA